MPHLDSILIIDDNPFLADLYRTVLEGEGFEVLLAFSGEEALELLAKVPAPRLILLDCSMPKMSGEDFLDRLGEHFPEVAKQSRIVGFSSFTDETPHIRDFATRVAEYVTKPSELNAFIALIHDQVAKAGFTPESPSRAT